MDEAEELFGLLIDPLELTAYRSVSQTRSCEMNVCYVRVYAANILNMNSDSQKDKKTSLSERAKQSFHHIFFKMLHGNTAAETEAMFLLLIQTVRSVRRKSVDVPSVLGERGCFGDQWRSLIIITKLKTDTLFSQDGRHKHTIIFTDTMHRCRLNRPTVDKLVQ